MRRAEIAEQDRYQLARQREFRMAADVVCDAWAGFAEVEAVAVIGSVAKRLWKEVPRSREFRREGIEVLHYCRDLDLALWLDSQSRLGELRRASASAWLVTNSMFSCSSQAPIATSVDSALTTVAPTISAIAWRPVAAQWRSTNALSISRRGPTSWPGWRTP